MNLRKQLSESQASQLTQTRLKLLEKRLDVAEKTMTFLESKYPLQRWEPNSTSYKTYLIQYCEMKIKIDLQAIRQNAVSRSLELAGGMKHIGKYQLL